MIYQEAFSINNTFYLVLFRRDRSYLCQERCSSGQSSLKYMSTICMLEKVAIQPSSQYPRKNREKSVINQGVLTSSSHPSLQNGENINKHCQGPTTE